MTKSVLKTQLATRKSLEMQQLHLNSYFHHANQLTSYLYTNIARSITGKKMKRSRDINKEVTVW